METQNMVTATLKFSGRRFLKLTLENVYVIGRSPLLECWGYILSNFAGR